jgi:hypothetical protein
MKKLLTKTEASIYVTPYKDLINKLIRDAVQSYKDKPALDRLIDSARTRGSSISDRILWNIANCKTLLGDNDIKIKKRYGSIRILIKGKAQVVFKKVNENLLPSSPCTNRSLNFMNQSDDINKEFPEIAGMPPVTNLYWGYIWNPLDEIRTPIVCLDGSQLLWDLESFEESQTATTKEISDMPKKNSTQKIRPKKSLIKKRPLEGNDDGNIQTN